MNQTTAFAGDPETCGNCKHGQRADLNVVECYGVPPTPVATAQGRDMAGQTQVAIQLLRPRLPANERACSLWSFRQQILDLSASRVGEVRQ